MSPTTTVGVIGSGSMGRGMALLYSEKGNIVHIFDVDKEAMKSVKREAEETDSVPAENVHMHDSLESLANAFDKDKPRLLILSLPHGPKVVDSILTNIESLLKDGDIIIDGDNEYYGETERRQEWMKKKGVAYIGMGVSGGYQASRRGPSMSPGGDYEAYQKVEPYLKEWAAKDKDGNACVEWVGPGGAGHYVKMIHNGIEQGELSVLAEAYTLLHRTLGIPNSEIKQIFTDWDAHGELSDNFLVDLGALVVGFTEGDGVQNDKGIIDNFSDKVTQDVDQSEGTGVWTVKESAERHVAAPTIATAHYLRVISAEKRERNKIKKMLNIPQVKPHPSAEDKKKYIELVRLATYGGFLCSFIQGLNMIARASVDFKWDVPMEKCLKIWRAGCIIRSGYIADLIQPLYKANPKLLNLLTEEAICKELNKTFHAMKEVVKLAIEADAVIPAVSASLEYIKSVGCEDPTAFEESQLDAFGDHMYTLKSDNDDRPVKGSHHTEWRKA